MEKKIGISVTPELKKYLVVSVVALLIGGAIGRYSVPTKTEIKTEYVETLREVVKTQFVEVTKTVQAKERVKVVERVTQYNADGSWLQSERESEAEKERLEQENTKRFEENVDRAVARKESKLAKTEYAQPQWHVSAIVLAPNSYGAAVSKKILGPIDVGVIGILNNGAPTVGATLGISF